MAAAGGGGGLAETVPTCVETLLTAVTRWWVVALALAAESTMNCQRNFFTNIRILILVTE